MTAPDKREAALNGQVKPPRWLLRPMTKAEKAWWRARISQLKAEFLVIFGN